MLICLLQANIIVLQLAIKTGMSGDVGTLRHKIIVTFVCLLRELWPDDVAAYRMMNDDMKH